MFTVKTVTGFEMVLQDAGPDANGYQLWRQIGVGKGQSRYNREMFKMPAVWAKELGLPDVGPIWGEYPISKPEFLARQEKYGDSCKDADQPS